MQTHVEVMFLGVVINSDIFTINKKEQLYI